MVQIRAAFSGFSVNNIDKAKQFYTETIGLKLVDESMGLRFELPSGGELFIYSKEGHEPASFTILNFVVDDIDRAVDELTGRGVHFERYDNMPGEQDAKGILRGLTIQQGPDIAWFKDPAGNILSVLQDKK
jgi:catechol 2,3-dioxygenase-like lactoylglutathione lyase family enzyme